jgi:hypothetical protein
MWLCLTEVLFHQSLVFLRLPLAFFRIIVLETPIPRAALAIRTTSAVPGAKQPKRGGES